MHLQMMLDELEGIKEPSSSPVPILLDNRSTIDVGASYKDTKHTRHIMRKYHYVREGVDSKKHTLIWIPTEFQLADLGTKVLTAARVQFLLRYMMVKVKDEQEQESSVQEG